MVSILLWSMWIWNLHFSAKGSFSLLLILPTLHEDAQFAQHWQLAVSPVLLSPELTPVCSQEPCDCAHAMLCKLRADICRNIPHAHYIDIQFEVGKLWINDWKRWFSREIPVQHSSALTVIKYLNLNFTLLQSTWAKAVRLNHLGSNCESADIQRVLPCWENFIK